MSDVCSIVVPCYNEERNIPLILKRFASVMSTLNIEVVLVNNGSKDNSQNVMRELQSVYSFFQICKVDFNQGYGYGILAGLKQAKGDFLGWTHADMQTDPADVIKGFQLIKDAAQPTDTFVKGLRKGRPLFDQIFTSGMSFYESLLLRKKLVDINAQPNIFHRSFYETWQTPPHDFSLDLYALYLARAMNLEIKRFDVVFPPREHGLSSWNHGLKSKWKFIKRTVHYSQKLKKELR